MQENSLLVTQASIKEIILWIIQIYQFI
jgi:hypothetical protein